MACRHQIEIRIPAQRQGTPRLVHEEGPICVKIAQHPTGFGPPGIAIGMGTGQTRFNGPPVTATGFAKPTAAIPALFADSPKRASMGTITATIHVGLSAVADLVVTTGCLAEPFLTDPTQTIAALEARLSHGAALGANLTAVQISLITIVDPIVATRRSATVQTTNPTDAVLWPDALLLRPTGHSASRTTIEIRLGAVQNPIVTTGSRTLALTAQPFETIAVCLATGSRGTKRPTGSTAIRTGLQAIVLTIIASCGCEQPAWAGADERQQQYA